MNDGAIQQIISAFFKYMTPVSNLSQCIASIVKYACCALYGISVTKTPEKNYKFLDYIIFVTTVHFCTIKSNL